MSPVTLGYIVVEKGFGPQARCRGLREFYCLCRAGGRNAYATVFESREQARTMILADREYRRHFPSTFGEFERDMRVVRPTK
jgi:hypothetical protein